MIVNVTNSINMLLVRQGEFWDITRVEVLKGIACMNHIIAEAAPNCMNSL